MSYIYIVTTTEHVHNLLFPLLYSMPASFIYSMDKTDLFIFFVFTLSSPLLVTYF